MATFENTVTIRRSVEDVFTFIADFEKVSTWNNAIMVAGSIGHFRSRVGYETLIALAQAGRSHSSSQPWPVISRFLGALSPPNSTTALFG